MPFFMCRLIRLDPLHIQFCLFQTVGQMIFQIIHQIDVQDLDLAGNIDQGGNGEVAVKSKKADRIKGGQC